MRREGRVPVLLDARILFSRSVLTLLTTNRNDIIATLSVSQSDSQTLAITQVRASTHRWNERREICRWRGVAGIPSANKDGDRLQVR